VGGSVFKLAFSELRQKVAQLGMDLLGPAGTSLDEPEGAGSEQALGEGALVELWLNAFNRTIAAGTSQIQRNIVAERILGLPKA